VKAGYTHTPFSRAMWDRWLERLNTAPDPKLLEGIAEMRSLLASRCLGRVRESLEDTGEFRSFVARNFGSVR
jgi:hypothetical protein